MPEVIDTKLIVTTAKGTRIKAPATLEYESGRIFFLKSPFALKDEIKAMQGSKWHGFEEENPRKIWSIQDSQRNRFQLAYLMGENPYEWFDRDLVTHKYDRPLKLHQCLLADSNLTYHYQINAAEMGVGKTLAAIETMEQSGVVSWWYVAPKKALDAVKREFKKWGLDRSINIELLTYEAFTRRMDEWTKDQPIPQGVIFDESSRCKNWDSQRTKAAAFLADHIRCKYGFNGFVILMSGTPSPKTPADWWSQCEIAYPGFLREGSERAFKSRLGILAQRNFGSGGIHNELLGWKDDEAKCAVCGKYLDEGPHTNSEFFLDFEEGETPHDWLPSKNEVALLYERLQGLVVVVRKKDCLDLPDKVYRIIHCKPTSSTLRVASALMQSAPNTITGLTLLRELSDGFQYREKQEGTATCGCCQGSGEIDEWFGQDDRTYSAIDMLRPEVVATFEKRRTTCPSCDGAGEEPRMVRHVREVPCPKEEALVELLEECEDTGRIVVFAGFTGSVDRVVNVCLSNGWDVVRCDGRGWQVSRKESDGEVQVLHGVDALDYWADRAANPKVAFVGHPESGGMGLTLTESSMIVFWSNSFKPEYRIQAEDRIHRQGMDENRGAVIVDLIHLPTDERVLQVIRENRRLELMTLGDFSINEETNEE